MYQKHVISVENVVEFFSSNIMTMLRENSKKEKTKFTSCVKTAQLNHF